MHFSTNKLKLNSDDMKNICLIYFSENVCCWKTATYMSNVKFVYQLWQNKRNLGCGHAYGNPLTQSPYCTHTYKSYEEFRKNVDPYYLFWFLKKVSNIKYEIGDLNTPNVFNIFCQMKKCGYELLLGQNDSNYNLLDNYDISIPLFYKSSYNAELNKMNNTIVKDFHIVKR